jgi:hypothetical protein
MAKASKRSFVEAPDFRTTAGFGEGAGARAPQHRACGGPRAVITDFGILTPHPVTDELQLSALFADVTVDDVRAAIGWPAGGGRRGYARRTADRARTRHRCAPSTRAHRQGPCGNPWSCLPQNDDQDASHVRTAYPHRASRPERARTDRARCRSDLAVVPRATIRS